MMRAIRRYLRWRLLNGWWRPTAVRSSYNPRLGGEARSLLLWWQMGSGLVNLECLRQGKEIKRQIAISPIHRAFPEGK
jgi:hypothetical protein